MRHALIGIVASLEEGTIRITECIEQKLCTTLRERGYITEANIEPLEAALQATRGKLSVDGKSGWDAAIHILKEARIKLKLFIAYMTLRRRYPRVHAWTRKDTLIAYNNTGRRIEVLVLEEGEEVTVEEIATWSKAAAKDDHEPVVAVVDRNGSVTMYSARAVTSLY